MRSNTSFFVIDSHPPSATSTFRLQPQPWINFHHRLKTPSRRPADDPNKTQHLLALDGAKERLSLFEANLTEQGSFESAANGCECVFYMTSPVIPSVSLSNPKAQFLDPAVTGTLNVLKSAAKVPSLKRVVLTSSMTAVMFRVEPWEFGAEVDETWFSDPETCEQKKKQLKLEEWTMKLKFAYLAWMITKKLGVILVSNGVKNRWLNLMKNRFWFRTYFDYGFGIDWNDGRRLIADNEIAGFAYDDVDLMKVKCWVSLSIAVLESLMSILVDVDV
ncbi:unnamed protein product [Lactuca virosa]|uniref:3-beta hydroxysteroid dehydrogenase/isomerase domain-containing protein n=1 Tax=Lactuca virosa TaxID=75947 RepID=A0AAU9PP37_9ASTR|nr:unnamed protein product [Lactuca virosa]